MLLFVAFFHIYSTLANITNLAFPSSVHVDKEISMLSPLGLVIYSVSVSDV